LATGFEIANLNVDLGTAQRQRLRLMPIEFQLLLTPIDLQLARVGILANAGGTRIRLSLLETQPPEIAFHFCQPRGGRRLTLASQIELGERTVDARGQLAIAAREQEYPPNAAPLAPSRCTD